MSYIIRVEKDIDFSRAEKAMISTYKWTEGYAPEAFAELIYVEDKGFALRMTAKESNPLAVNTEYNQPVYEDSCLEFFVRFNPEDPKYMNFEMNSNGAFLSAVRVDRSNKTPIHTLAEIPVVKATKGETEWTVEVFFTLDFIGKLFGKTEFSRGEVIKGNFYKCGDKTEIPHFGMWAPIDSEKPNFHQPQFFGEMEIEK
ncbi:MAG: hypothetical protein IKU30_04095 [Clostridia bacterium]|nr:hypothetical protein [Clostridia bacterium]